jgi:hypothetical protein
MTGVQFPAGGNISLFAIVSKPVLVPTQLPVQQLLVTYHAGKADGV